MPRRCLGWGCTSCSWASGLQGLGPSLLHKCPMLLGPLLLRHFPLTLGSGAPKCDQSMHNVWRSELRTTTEAAVMFPWPKQAIGPSLFDMVGKSPPPTVGRDGCQQALIYGSDDPRCIAFHTFSIKTCSLHNRIILLILFCLLIMCDELPFPCRKKSSAIYECTLFYFMVISWLTQSDGHICLPPFLPPFLFLLKAILQCPSSPGQSLHTSVVFKE